MKLVSILSLLFVLIVPAAWADGVDDEDDDEDDDDDDEVDDDEVDDDEEASEDTEIMLLSMRLVAAETTLLAFTPLELVVTSEFRLLERLGSEEDRGRLPPPPPPPPPPTPLTVMLLVEAMDAFEAVTDVGGGVVEAELDVPLLPLVALAAFASAEADIAFSKLFTFID